MAILLKAFSLCITCKFRQISPSLYWVSSAMDEHKKVFSLSEVSLHTSNKDCWLIIDGKVYDVSDFLEEHPGGDGVLIEASANGDATKDFEEVGHSSTAISMMSSYLIGVVEGSHSGLQQSSKAKEKEEEEGFVKVKKLQEDNPSTFSTFLDFFIPLLIVLLAFGAWYFYRKEKP